MSIAINKSKCVKCRRCIEVCPGNLIKADADGKAYIKEPRDCWGCTSCVKECRAEAIDFFLGADIGGRGSTLTTREDGDYRLWTVTAPDGNKTVVRINKKTPTNIKTQQNRGGYFMSGLSHLDELEAEAIYIIREVAAECEKPVMLYSIGKDSSVMLHLAMKAFTRRSRLSHFTYRYDLEIP